jgi:uncharacterized membrane protein YfcA|tara:strand:- start:71840 stop:72574 length:735 start_codon:yes stop_codon:yes gene_type:complete
MMDNLLLFLFLAFLAEIVGTMGGFGSSLFFVPIASYFLDFHSVLGITAIFHVVSNLSKIVLFRKGVDKKLILYLGIPAVIFVYFGAYFSKYLVTDKLEIVLAIFLIVTSLVFLIFKTFKIAANKRNSIIGGALSGGVAGLIGTGGAIRGITLAAFSLKTEAFIATSAIIDFGVDSTRGVVYWMNGYIHPHDLYLIPFLFGIGIIGTYIGKRLLAYVSEQKFKVFVLILVFLTGVITLLKAYHIF